MDRYLCVTVGGGAGALTRYLVNRFFVQQFPNANFAIGTFFINISGSFLIGFLMTLLAERFRVSPIWQLLAVTGFLGGYTTFSSFEYEGLLSVRAGRPGAALFYLAGSVCTGYVAVWLGALAAAKRTV